MNLTKKIKKRIKSCISLAIVGDTISFCMAIVEFNLQFKKKYEKDKIELIQKLNNENNLNIKGWIHSYYSIWLFAKPYKSKDINLKKHTENSHQKIDLIKKKQKKDQDRFGIIMVFLKQNLKKLLEIQDEKLLIKKKNNSK